MKWMILTVWIGLFCFAGSVEAGLDDTLHREIRLIRRAYLDVTGMLPTPEEIDWYVVYNRDGYRMAVDYLVNEKKGSESGWTPDLLLSEAYRNAEGTSLDIGVLERNVVYLAGLWKGGEFNEELLAAGSEKFIRDALLTADDNAGNAIDYMVNALTCRPATAEEETDLLEIYNKISLKSDEAGAWKTVLMHIFQLPECRFK
jgi:hypothetical protein